jgi:hypothetical protein
MKAKHLKTTLAIDAFIKSLARKDLTDIVLVGIEDETKSMVEFTFGVPNILEDLTRLNKVITTIKEFNSELEHCMLDAETEDVTVLIPTKF